MTHPHLNAPAADLPAAPRILDWRELADEVTASAALTAAQGPAVHVVAVDGFSGSGKSWLADRLARALGAPLVHVDELVPGWDALADGIAHVGEHLLHPWSQGRAARVRQYDWHAARPGEWLDLPPEPVVVVEGSGIGAVADRSLLSTLVWVETPAALRDDRLARRSDHELYAPYRQMWAAQERALVERAATPARADVVVLDADETRVQLASCRPSDPA